MQTEPIPDGAYTVTVTCSKCGQDFETWTDANMSDPEVASIVRRFMGVVCCDACKDKTPDQHFKPPWEQPRIL